MAHQFTPDVEDLIRQFMADGNYQSEDELMRDALDALATRNADLDAVQESIDTLEQGEQGVSLDEAFDIVRKRNNIAQDA